VAGRGLAELLKIAGNEETSSTLGADLLSTVTAGA
jgi:hypothetical protein